LFSTICLVHSICGQKAIVGKYEVRGIIRDQNSAVIPALSLSIKKKDGEIFGGFTDINGNFEIGVSPGDYEITASGISEAKFKLFLKILEQGPNPQNLELIVDSSALCEKEFKNVTYPPVIKSSIPKAPPAAIAVRALGTVTVMLKLSSDGKVIWAKAVSGHPLLRPTSEMAARQFEFDLSKNAEVRSVQISFIYIDSGMSRREINRFECPYRIVVIIPSEKIETRESSD